MQVYNNVIPSFVQSSLDFKQVLSENAQKYAKIVAITLAIFAAAVAIYYAVKSYAAIKVECPDQNDLVTENPVLRKLSDWAKYFFPDNPLQDYTNELAGHIHEILKDQTISENTKNNLINLADFLASTDHKSAIDNYYNFRIEYKDTVYQSFTDSYKTLCQFFKDDQFPIEKKMEVLDRLENERHLCIPGQANLLNDICSSMDEPAEMAEKLPWLIARYKIEIIKAEIKNSHVVNQVIKTYGMEFNLPDSVMKAAQTDHIAQDDFRNYFDAADQRRGPDEFLVEFGYLCNPMGCLDFLEDYINSDLPGRGAYRAYILSSLAEKVTEEQVDDPDAVAFCWASHEAALENEEKVEKERHLKKFEDNPDSPEAKVDWAKIMKKINLKKDPFIDEGLYANYHYRLNPEDSEDNKLTREALELFADDALHNLHEPRTKSP